MRTIKNVATNLMFLLLGGLGVINARASLSGPSVLAPGGDGVVAGSSFANEAAGQTFSYSGFNSSAFSELYWGLSIPASSSLKTGGNMVFQSIQGTRAIWTGPATYLDGSGNTQTAQTYLVITVSGLGSTPWVLASSLGLDPTYIGAVANNSSGQNFSVNLAFLADLNGGSSGDAIPLNSAPNAGGDSYGIGFYSAPPVAGVVPEPSTWVAGALLLVPFAVQGIRSCTRRTQRNTSGDSY